MLSPSLHLGASSNYGGTDHYSILKLILGHWTFMSFFSSGTTPFLHHLTSVSHLSDFFWCSGTTLFWLPHPGTPSNSSGFFPFLETSIFGNVVCPPPFQPPWFS